MRLAQVVVGGGWLDGCPLKWEEGITVVGLVTRVLDQGRLLEEDLHRAGHRAKMEETLLGWESLLVIQSGSG